MKKKTDLIQSISHSTHLYAVENDYIMPKKASSYIHEIYETDTKSLRALSAPKHALVRLMDYLYPLPDGKTYGNHLTKKFLPDEALYNIDKNSLHIIEKKFQQGPGSVDEKPHAAVFLLWAYRKMFAEVGCDITLTYIFNKDWWSDPRYGTTLSYLDSLENVNYTFDQIDLSHFFE